MCVHLLAGVELGEACTIVLRGATQQILDEAERSIHDALCVLAQTVKETKIVFGGGRYHILKILRMFPNFKRLNPIDPAEFGNDVPSVLPRPFSKGGTPCPVLMTPCLFQEAEMTPCLFLVTPNDALLQFLFCHERHSPR